MSLTAAVRSILSAASVTLSDVAAYRSEAAAAGDCDAVCCCDLVTGDGDYDGDTDREKATRDVVRAIADARAQG